MDGFLSVIWFEARGNRQQKPAEGWYCTAGGRFRLPFVPRSCMFTGLVQTVGSVVSTEQHPAQSGAVRLIVQPNTADSCTIPVPSPGDSICVSGCCLTLVEANAVGWVFDVIAESISRTWFATLKPGMKVNLEQSCTPTTLLGGHIVQGHVDGLATVDAVSTSDGYRVRLSLDNELMQYVAPKGSVTIDGVSLTVASLSVAERWFEVALIPETLVRTTLADREPGDRIHFEADCMVKAAVHWIRHYARTFASDSAD